MEAFQTKLRMENSFSFQFYPCLLLFHSKMTHAKVKLATMELVSAPRIVKREEELSLELVQVDLEFVALVCLCD